MLKPYDQVERVSKEDGGLWVDQLSLFEIDGKVYLKEEFGYAQPDDENWYEASAKPTVKLEDRFGENCGAFCGNGKSVFEEELGVELTECEDPTDD